MCELICRELKIGNISVSIFENFAKILELNNDVFHRLASLGIPT